MSTTSIGVDRTGPAIRAALAAHAPQRCADFEAEFRIALAETDEDFDLSRVQAVIDKWRPIAYARLNPPTEEERARIDRFHAGDDAGLLQQRDDGSWVRL